MDVNERRSTPRLACRLPVRFRILQGASKPNGTALQDTGATPAAWDSTTFEGEAINISEHGIYFKSSKNLRIGVLLEMYFILPRQLTGRSPERVTCKARVTYIDRDPDSAGARGVGVAVDHFEPQTAMDGQHAHQDIRTFLPRVVCP